MICWKYSHGQHHLLNTGHTITVFMGLMKKLNCVYATWQIYGKVNYQAVCTTAQWFSDKINTVKSYPHFILLRCKPRFQLWMCMFKYIYCKFRRIQVGAVPWKYLINRILKSIWNVLCWETVLRGFNRTNMSLSKETLLGAQRQNFKQTEDDLRGDSVTQVQSASQ